MSYGCNVNGTKKVRTSRPCEDKAETECVPKRNTQNTKKQWIVPHRGLSISSGSTYYSMNNQKAACTDLEAEAEETIIRELLHLSPNLPQLLRRCRCSPRGT